MRSPWTVNDYGLPAFALALPQGKDTLGAPRPLDETAAQSFRRAVASHGEWSLAPRKGGDRGLDAILDIRKGDQTVASMERGSTDGERHTAYTFTPDGDIVISGGSWGVLTAYDLSGEKLPNGDFIGHEGDIWAVAVSPDGAYLVSGGADQTVRLWNVKTRELIVTLFRGTDGEWVAYTPQGYYTASEKGAKLVTWQANKGPEHAACAVSGEQLYKRMNRPALVARAIELASAEKAIAESPDEKDFKLSSLLKDCAPALHLIGPDETEAITGGRATLALALEPNVLPLKNLSIYVNGGKIEARPTHPPRPVTAEGFEIKAFNIPLATGANDVTVTAENEAGVSAPLTYHLYHVGEGELVRGALHVVAIGVDLYPEAAGAYANLNAAVHDAVSFVKTAVSEIGRAYASTKVSLLVNRAALTESVAWPAIEPTKANIETVLSALETVREGDMVVLFLAGHGERRGDRYFFLPTNVRKKLGDQPGDGDNLLDWTAIMARLTKAKGVRVLLGAPQGLCAKQR